MQTNVGSMKIAIHLNRVYIRDFQRQHKTVGKVRNNGWQSVIQAVVTDPERIWRSVDLFSLRLAKYVLQYASVDLECDESAGKVIVRAPFGYLVQERNGFLITFWKGPFWGGKAGAYL